MPNIKDFVSSQKGMIIIAEIIFTIIIVISFRNYVVGYLSLSTVMMILAIIFFVFYALDLNKSFSIIPLIDFFRALIGAILYLVTSVIILTEERVKHVLVGAILGIVAAILFGYDASMTNPWKK